MFERKTNGMKLKMTQLSLVLFFVVSASQLFAQGASLEVVVKNIKNTKGTIRIGLFDKADTFLKTDPYKGKVVSASGTEVKVIFENLPAGEYAVSIIHDENKNGELDANVFGMPKEGFAFGNNAMGTFGPPSFDKAKVKVDGVDVVQVISLKYL
jgi:uncharacterized protein (DUF2141 family)